VTHSDDYPMPVTWEANDLAEPPDGAVVVNPEFTLTGSSLFK
jgi:hypothetical protein